MRDQATDLRKLVLQSMRDAAAPVAPAPRLVMVSGAQEGVGVTTIAIRLSIEFAMQGSRVVLVDGDQEHFDIAGQLGLSIPMPRELAANTTDIHELFVRGPAGILVLPGLWPPESPSSFTDTHQYRLIQQIQKLGRHADLVLVDIGSSSGALVNRFWDAADAVFMVTEPDAIAVMNCYARIKSHLHAAQTTPVYLIVNRSDADTCSDVFRRVNQSCQRFLDINLEQLGHVPIDRRIGSTPVAGESWAKGSTDSPFCRAVEQLASIFVSNDRMVKRNRFAA